MNLRNCAVALLLALLVFEALSFVFLGRLNRDEGWYLYAARLVYEGRVPYRDFAFFQTPLVPYLFGLPQHLLGGGVLVGRLTALAFSAGALGAGLYLARRLGGPGAVAPWLLLTLLNPSLMAAYTSARAEAPSIAFLMVALMFLLVPPRSPSLRLVAAPLALAAASLCRLSFLPAFLLVTAYVWATTPESAARRLRAAALLAAPVVATLLLAGLAGFDRFWFDVWTSQADRAAQLDPQALSVGDSLTRSLWLVELSLSTHVLVLVPAVFLAGWLAARWREGWRPRRAGLYEDPEGRLALTLALGTVAFLPFLALRTFEPRYLAPTAAVVAVGVAVALGRDAGGETRVSRRTLAGAFAVLLVLALPLIGNHYPTYIDARRPDLHGLRQAAAGLRDTVAPGTRLATFDATLAVESGLPLARGLEMAHFSYWPALSDEEASRLRLVNDALLRAALTDGSSPLLVAFADFDLYLLGTSGGEGSLTLLTSPDRFYPAELRDHWSQFDDRLHILRPVGSTPAASWHRCPPTALEC